MRLLEEDLRARPAVTHERRADLLRELLGVRVSKATICRTVSGASATLAKKIGATQRD